MKISHGFFPLLKETPAEASIPSHQLMLRAGLITQIVSGIYSWLPLGLKVLKKVENIIREEQNAIGCQEILMPTVQPMDLWRESGRHEAYGPETLRFKDRHNKDLLYAPTHEEIITDIFRKFITSYKDLPLTLYQIHWKFRDEIRPRFGVMRSREFFMKDGYSFDLNEQSAEKTYFKIFMSYLKIFARMGLSVVPVRADTGVIGGSLSHEFHVLAQTGESQIFYDKTFESIDFMDPSFDLDSILSLYAMADEMHNPQDEKDMQNLQSSRGIEVGHIFSFGQKYSLALQAGVQNKDNQIIYPYMGSYGIGVGRLVAAIIESFHDEKGIIWPLSVAPYQIALLNLKVDNKECQKAADDLYLSLQKMGFEVLYDDRAVSIGNKFNSMDLIGLPWQVIIGPKTIEKKYYEIKERKTGYTMYLSLEEVLQYFEKHKSW